MPPANQQGCQQDVQCSTGGGAVQKCAQKATGSAGDSEAQQNTLIQVLAKHPEANGAGD